MTTRTVRVTWAGEGWPMGTSDNTTMRLSDTSSSAPAASFWLVWSGLGAAPPILLGGDKVLLGRGADAPGRLDFPGVSRQHAELFRQGPLYGVRDLGSTNGTYLNGERIESAALSEGDVLRVGDAVAVAVRLRDDLGPPTTNEAIKGILFGPGLAEVLEMVRHLAPDSLPVVLEGATGVGKEGVARALHELSGRKGPLQAVESRLAPATGINCSRVRTHCAIATRQRSASPCWAAPCSRAEPYCG